MQKQWLSLLLVAAAVDAASVRAARAAGAVGCKGIEINGPRFSGTQLTLAGSPCPPGSLSLREVDLGRGVQVLEKGAPRLVLDASLAQGALALGGAAVKGALLWGAATDGTPLRLRVDEVALPGAGQRLPLYGLSYQSGEGKNPSDKAFLPAQDTWTPLCPAGEKAVMLPGRWEERKGAKGQGGRVDKDGVTVACQGSALAKCAERFGYLPWKHGREHEACVRAVRADYCGNGESMTQPGKEINIYDSVGVQKDAADWPLEAEWTEAGARCVERPRLAQSPQKAGETPLDYVRRACPERLRPCAAVKGPAAVLKTEAPRP